MNRTLAASIAALLLAASFDASAADSSVARAATGVGRWIAAQGNAALRDIADEVRQQLLEQLAPVLPASDDLTVEPQPQAAIVVDGSKAS